MMTQILQHLDVKRDSFFLFQTNLALNTFNVHDLSLPAELRR